MNMKHAQAFLLATAAASLFASGTVLAADHPTSEAMMVHCGGVNACKGQSDCKTAHNACKGHNSCKGQGFKLMSKTQCDAAGGHIIK